MNILILMLLAVIILPAMVFRDWKAVVMLTLGYLAGICLAMLFWGWC